MFESIVCPASQDNARNSEGDIIELTDGRLILGYSDFKGFGDNTSARISARISEDRGRTWGEKFALEKNRGGINVMEVSFLRLASGEILFFFMQKNSLSDCKAYVRMSEDETASWSDRVCATPCQGYMQLTNGGAVQLTSGRILVPVSCCPVVEGIGHFVCFCFLSDDNGKTWLKSCGQIDLPKRGADEAKTVELRDGRIMMVIRNQLGHLHRSYSSDDGVHWSEPEPMPLVSSESPAAVKRIPATGDLLILWNNTYDPANRAHHYGGRSSLVSAVSGDEGNTWQNIKSIENDAEHDFGYPTITFVKDEVLLTYYVAQDNHRRWSLKVNIVPVDWFYH